MKKYLLSAMLILGFVASQQALAEYQCCWQVEFDSSTEPVTTEPVTTEQLDAWEKQATEGDIKLQRQFAYAVLMRWLAAENFCSLYKYGHRCRAMQTRLAFGETFARYTAELEPPTPEKDKFGDERKDIASFQYWYGQKRLMDAAPKLDREGDACKDAVRYLTSAADNGHACAARLFSGLAKDGSCMQANDAIFDKYARMSSGCPYY